MQKQIDRGVAVPRDEEELQAYKGPLNYVAHFAVFNPESPSTKLRIVSHSALKNIHTGLSVNDCMYEGPNQLTDLQEVLIKFRGFEKALLMDLSKAYQALKTGKKEADLRLFLWRKGPEQEWQSYSYVCVNFGDQIAALCLELAKKITADRGRSVDELACQLLTEAMYVDDFLGGGTWEEVLRM